MGTVGEADVLDSHTAPVEEEENGGGGDFWYTTVSRRSHPSDGAVARGGEEGASGDAEDRRGDVGEGPPPVGLEKESGANLDVDIDNEEEEKKEEEEEEEEVAGAEKTKGSGERPGMTPANEGDE